MNEYMAIIQFNSSINEDVISLIDQQHAYVHDLMEKGALIGYSLSANRKTLWMNLLAASPEAVEKMLQLMPLYAFMRYEIVELMFHSSPSFIQMPFSMN